MAGKEITDFSDNALSIIAFNSLCLYLLFSFIACKILGQSKAKHQYFRTHPRALSPSLAPRPCAPPDHHLPIPPRRTWPAFHCGGEGPASDTLRHEHERQKSLSH